jgi:hypothetical protein
MGGKEWESLRLNDKFATKTCEIAGALFIGASPQLMRRGDGVMLSPMGRRRRFRGHTGEKSP